MSLDRVTSHKLIFHPDRVSRWLNTGDDFPINAEIAISGACNHRCVFCCVDYTKYKPVFLKRDLLKERMKEMNKKGLKSVLLAGNGEPLINNEASEIINDMNKIGLDVALSTNGVLFTEDIAEKCMESLSWIRFSTSAGTEENYQKIHRGQPGDLQRVFDNIEGAAKIKKKRNLKTVLNVQIVMTAENMDEVVMLAKKVKELGADRFIAKTIGWSSAMENELGRLNIEKLYNNHEEICSELEILSDKRFECVYRTDRLEHRNTDRSYSECFGAAFHVAIDSNGDVVPCCNFLGLKEMSYGNINQQSFDDIWNGTQRKKVLDKLCNANLAMCPLDCKLANVNDYLQSVKYPSEHVNFI